MYVDWIRVTVISRARASRIVLKGELPSSCSIPQIESKSQVPAPVFRISLRSSELQPSSWSHPGGTITCSFTKIYKGGRDELIVSFTFMKE